MNESDNAVSVSRARTLSILRLRLVALNEQSDGQWSSCTRLDILITRSSCGGERLFLYGDYEVEKLHDSIRRMEEIPYFIKRDIIQTCIENIKNNNNNIITGDLGNGKSIVLEMLAYELTVNGYHTYMLRNNNGDYVSDLRVGSLAAAACHGLRLPL